MSYTQEVMRDLEGYIKPEEVKRVMDNTKCERDRLLILIGWRTGRRISEILPLKKRDINFDRSLIKFRILKKKNKEYQKLKPVDKNLLHQLFIYTSKMDNDDFLFKGYHSHLTRQQAYNIIRKAAEGNHVPTVGLKPTHPHHLRHGFAVNFLRKCKNKTVALKILQEVLEHSNIGMTSHYLQFNQEDLKEELDNVFQEE